MIVEDVAIQPCEMPLEDKDWKFALASVSSARGFVVAIRADSGHIGYGYAPAIPHMGSTFDMLPKELERFKPIVVGKDPFAVEAILQELDASLVGEGEPIEAPAPRGSRPKAQAEPEADAG